jgi:hypothetical protein
MGCRLHKRRRLHRVYASSLATFATRQAAGGRHRGGRLNSRDAISQLAQKRRGFRVRSLNPRDFYGDKPLLADRGQFIPADAAAFNLDYRDWLNRFNHRHRRIIKTLAGGEHTMAVADRFCIGPSRVSQLRREYQQSWRRFQGEALAV